MTAAAFQFIQLADPQFGLFARFSGQSPEQIAEYRARGLNITPAPKTTGFAAETRLFTAAIETANRLRPAFVVVCGDIVNQWDDEGQAAEALRIGALLDDGIPLRWVAGNHDVGVDERHTVPTPVSLARYRAKFGPDQYAFQHGDTSFIVLNTAVMQCPDKVPGELGLQTEFLKRELAAARARGSRHTVLFTHHPLFIEEPDEDVPAEAHLTIPIARRRPVLELLREYNVDAVLAGHWHRNNYARDGALEMVASGSVGYPFGDDPSGYRVVQVGPDGVTHDWYAFGESPAPVAGADGA